MTRFSTCAVPHGSQCDLILTGEVDLQVAESLIRAGRLHLTGTGVQRLVIDLGAVTFMDSTGLGALVAIRNAAIGQGKQLVLRNVPARIRHLLGITGLDHVFAIESDGTSASNLDMQQSRWTAAEPRQ